jgi:hypothetical protein
MRRELALVVVTLSQSSVLAGAASAANPAASCNGILVSSLAGQPGVVGALTRAFHQEVKDAGLPPGSFDAAGAHEHAGGVGECLGT